MYQYATDYYRMYQYATDYYRMYQCVTDSASMPSAFVNTTTFVFAGGA
jgi:hypothetical protein